MSLMPLIDIAVFLTRLLVGSVLTIAGLLKLQDGSSRFLQSVLAYGLVKGRAARLMASYLPWLEVGCGLFLLLGLFLPVTALVSFGLLMIFTTAVVTAIVREKRVDCGCFSTTHRRNYVRWKLSYRNLVMMGLSVIIFNFGPGWLAVDNWLLSSLNSLIAVSVIQNGLTVVWLTVLLITVTLHLINWQYNRHLEIRNAT